MPRPDPEIREGHVRDPKDRPVNDADRAHVAKRKAEDDADRGNKPDK